MLFKFLPIEELAKRLMKSMKAPRDVKLRYTKHIAILVSNFMYRSVSESLVFFYFSVISSDMGVILQICMRNLKSGCAMTQILTGSQLWRRIVTSSTKQVSVSLVFLMDLRSKIKVAQLAIQIMINELTTGYITILIYLSISSDFTYHFRLLNILSFTIHFLSNFAYTT